MISRNTLISFFTLHVIVYSDRILNSLTRQHLLDTSDPRTVCSKPAHTHSQPHCSVIHLNQLLVIMLLFGLLLISGVSAQNQGFGS